MTLLMGEATFKLFLFSILILFLIVWRWGLINLFAWILDGFKIKGSIRKNHKILYFISWIYFGWKLVVLFMTVYIDEVRLN